MRTTESLDLGQEPNVNVDMFGNLVIIYPIFASILIM